MYACWHIGKKGKRDGGSFEGTQGQVGLLCDRRGDAQGSHESDPPGRSVFLISLRLCRNERHQSKDSYFLLRDGERIAGHLVGPSEDKSQPKHTLIKQRTHAHLGPAWPCVRRKVKFGAVNAASRQTERSAPAPAKANGESRSIICIENLAFARARATTSALLALFFAQFSLVCNIESCAYLIFADYFM